MWLSQLDAQSAAPVANLVVESDGLSSTDISKDSLRIQELLDEVDESGRPVGARRYRGCEDRGPRFHTLALSPCSPTTATAAIRWAAWSRPWRGFPATRHHSFVLMLEEATRYCELVESDGEVSPEDLRDGLLLALTDLLVVAYRLPDAEPDDGEEVPGVAHAEWERIFKHLGSRLEVDLYWSTLQVVPFDPERSDAGIGSLCDDLADIWRDLVAGLRALSVGISVNEVASEWKSGFESHWGQHAVNALRVLHALKFES